MILDRSPIIIDERRCRTLADLTLMETETDYPVGTA
jgi:hypothetical protein